ncbi:MAG: hypothetical protein KatS3mg111_1033 [Pirellulaceae bacterium]|nr:MAG: hypothetical protein KatS3mg111_1033 [Pirellulaceae bacterium]
MLKVVFQWIQGALATLFSNINWAIQEADLTQWAIISIAFVAAGFLCMKGSR